VWICEKMKFGFTSASPTVPNTSARSFSKFWTHHITCTCSRSTVTAWSLTARTYRQPLSALGVNVLCHESTMDAATDQVSLKQWPEIFDNNPRFAPSKCGSKQYSLYAMKVGPGREILKILRNTGKLIGICTRCLQDAFSWSQRSLLLLYAFFWVIHRRLKCISQRFGTLCSILIGI
jgi:hypothetical protein